MEFEKMYNALMAQLKAEGFQSLEDFIAEYRKVKAALAQAEEARDKFSNQLEESNNLFRNKSGELGQKEARITELEAEVTQLKDDLEKAKAGITPVPKSTPTPGEPPQPKEKTVEEQIKEIEGVLSDEHKEEIDSLIPEMTDAQIAEVSGMTEARLQLLKDVVGDEALQQAKRPKSLFGEPTKPEEKGESIYTQLMKKRAGGRHVQRGPGHGGLGNPGNAKPSGSVKPTPHLNF